jgi:hypothetical protein
VNYDIEFTESGPFEVVVTTSGEASGAEIEAGRRRVLADPRFRPGMSIMLDHSLLDNSGAEAHEVRGLASSLDRDRASSGFAYLAIVAPDAVTYGLGRMWESLASEEVESAVTVVRTREEAYVWIESQRATAGSAQPN